MTRLADLSKEELTKVLSDLSDVEKAQLAYRWEQWARENQLPPPADADGPWGDFIGWLMLAGRGWGKTRVGAETVRAEVESGRSTRIAIVGETSADAKDVMVNGESGILAISPPWQRPVFVSSSGSGRPKLRWPNGAIGTLYDAREPDQLRGPQHDFIWADELAKYRYAEAVFDQMMFGLRLGSHPRYVVTTTPRNIQLIKDLVKNKSVHVTRGSSNENMGNLAKVYQQNVIDKYKGTRIGRQELNAEILEDTPGALWTRRVLDECRWTPDRQGPVPPLVRVAVGVDPAVTNTENSNETGIIGAGVDAKKIAYVLEDWSLKGSPDEWSRKAVALYRKLSADIMVAEANNGGEMVRMVINSVAPNIPVKLVHASRGKYTRAEPISALYEQGVVKHAGAMAVLEDQMTIFTPDPTRRGDNYSPDRVDALVWCLTELFPDVIERAAPRLPRVTAYTSRIPGMGMLG